MSVHSTPDLIADLRNWLANGWPDDQVDLYLAAAERLETFSKGVTAIVHLWDEFPEDVGDQVWVDCIEGLRGLISEEEEEVWPPHTGEGPDVSNLGNEAETTGLDEHGDPL